MIGDDEGMSYMGIMKERFGARERAEVRMKLERKAGQTPGERGRRGPPKQQVNFRTTADKRALIDALAAHLGKPIGDVMDLAIEALAKATPGFGGKK